MAVSDIKPGSQINVKVTSNPTSDGARKTIVRLLSKDADVKSENKRYESIRKTHTKVKTRGGRPWPIRMVKQRPVQGAAGESGTILATPDVLRDLNSVERFVEVSQA